METVVGPEAYQLLTSFFRSFISACDWTFSIPFLLFLLPPSPTPLIPPALLPPNP